MNQDNNLYAIKLKMSRDIRSFFVVKNPKNEQNTASSKLITQKSGQKKRSLVIIDSDSDEETSPIGVKRSKPSLEDKKLHKNKKDEVHESKSKYFEKHDVSAAVIFGSTPIKRDTSRKIIKKSVTKEEKEVHLDKNLEAELVKVDYIGLDQILKEDFTKNSFTMGLQNETGSEKAYTNDWDFSYKNISEMKDSESPKKKFKLENKLNSPGTKVEKNRVYKIDTPSKPQDHNKSPIKHSLSKTSPSKSPRKHSQSNESPLKNSALNTPDKSLIEHSPSKSSPRRSARKHSQSNESPLKRSTLNTPDKSLIKHSPSKSSPRRSARKHSQSNESPLKRSAPNTPDKSSVKKLSITRITKENYENKDSFKLNGNLESNTKQVYFSKTERKTEIPVEKEISSKQTSKTVEKSSLIKSNNGSEKNEFSIKIYEEVKDVPVLLTLSNLWVERYKPTATKQIIGQQGEKSCVNKLITWLKNWNKNHSGNKKLVKPSPWAKNDDGGFFKAALLSGPPGVGKTTTAHLVCKELGFDVVEFNASDTRSKKLLHEQVSELLSTKSLSPFFTGKEEQVTKRHVLLMDEVDGMAGNEDRGGVQELITLIRQSRVPVLCMCNDRNHPKIRSLANYCFDLRFSKPRVEQIRGAMMSVCFKEKLKLTPNVLTDIITSANQDIRLIMNHLSMLAVEKTHLANSTKHIKLGPWDIVRKIFSEEEHKSMSVYDKCDLFFHDYSVTPLFVQENYLNAVPHKPEAKNKIKKMELFAKAAKSLSFGDMTEKSIRSNNAWSLLPVQAIFSSLVPGDVLEGHLGAQINFPAWFGKNSRQTKMSRFIQELTVHSRLKISGNREAMLLDYLSALESAIVTPLQHDGGDGVTAALAVLSEYCLVRDDLESISELCSWPGSRNHFAEIDSKVKAAFTRAYNKTSVPTPYAAVSIKKGRGDVDIDGLGEEESGSQDVEEEEEGLETDSMIMVKKKPAGKKADKDVQASTSRSTKASKRGKKK